jgi:hypothetical protein
MARVLAALVLGLVVVGAAAAATIRGSARADRIQGADGRRQTIACGRAFDTVTADLADRVRADCELVSRRIARDTTAVGGAQHATIVEPDSASFGSTVVAAFQVGRMQGGGAGTIGWASSRDSGRTWRSGTLPGVGHASDPTVAYDARHGVWLIVTLGITNGPTSLDVNRSTNGRAWSRALPALAEPSQAFDKEWVFCDNGATSPRRGTCYLAYTDLATESIALTSSTDGGVTWSAPTRVSPRGDVVDALPAALLDGTLVVAWLGGRTILRRPLGQRRLVVRHPEAGRGARHVAGAGPSRPAASRSRRRPAREALARVARLPLPRGLLGERHRPVEEHGRRLVVRSGACDDGLGELRHRRVERRQRE